MEQLLIDADLGRVRARLAGSPFAPPAETSATRRILLELLGEPVGKARPRFSRRSGHAYTAPATVAAEANWRAAWHDAGGPRLGPGPIALALELVLERPKTHRRRDGSLSAEGLRYPWPLRRPDVDNALKLAMDALEGAAYSADAHVVAANVARRWARPGEVAHARLVLVALEEDGKP